MCLLSCPDSGHKCRRAGRSGSIPGVKGWGISLWAGLAVLLSAAGAHAAAIEGPRLAFLRFGVKPAALEIDVAGADGAALQRIAGGGRHASPLPSLISPISWSPDGSAVAFSGIGLKPR